MRPQPLLRLLDSVKLQTLYPNEIIIVDGSTNNETQNIFLENDFLNLNYFLVLDKDRGLTKQRNFGISKVASDSQIVCFLDDDTILENDYFEKIILTFEQKTDAIGVGGVAINENKWKYNEKGNSASTSIYILDNFYIKESSRNKLRNKLGLNSNLLPGIMPEFCHGKTCSYPLTGKIYPVDLIVGMSMSFRKELFYKISFSTYFEGYGLYEDADFSLRALKYGQNYISTSAQLRHYHDAAGRPNQYKYGKMVVRNGWYVWKVKFPSPSFKAQLKWQFITILLMIVRFSNVITENNKKEAFTETIGRFVGWLSLLVNKPKILDK